MCNKVFSHQHGCYFYQAISKSACWQLLGYSITCIEWNLLVFARTAYSILVRHADEFLVSAGTTTKIRAHFLTLSSFLPFFFCLFSRPDWFYFCDYHPAPQTINGRPLMISDTKIASVTVLWSLNGGRSACLIDDGPFSDRRPQDVKDSRSFCLRAFTSEHCP